MSFKRILIALDQSELAAHAAEVGLDLARALAAEVAFAYIVDITLSITLESGIPGGEMLQKSEREGKALLASLCKQAQLAREPEQIIALGRPTSEIVKAAKQWNADLIVLGSHSRTGIERLVVGSVAEGVLRSAPCPCLVVREKT